MRRLLLYIVLFCCVSMQGQTLEVLPAAEVSGVSLVLPSWKNFTALLLMDEEQQTAVLQGYGYTALQPMWGYRRYSNTQDELPSYMLGQHLLMYGILVLTELIMVRKLPFIRQAGPA